MDRWMNFWLSNYCRVAKKPKLLEFGRCSVKMSTLFRNAEKESQRFCSEGQTKKQELVLTSELSDLQNSIKKKYIKISFSQHFITQINNFRKKQLNTVFLFFACTYFTKAPCFGKKSTLQYKHTEKCNYFMINNVTPSVTFSCIFSRYQRVEG